MSWKTTLKAAWTWRPEDPELANTIAAAIVMAVTAAMVLYAL